MLYCRVISNKEKVICSSCGLDIYHPYDVTLDDPLRAAVAQWSRFWITHGRHVISSSSLTIKINRVGQRRTLNLSRPETSSRWCGVVVRRGGCQLRCQTRHLTLVQNYVVRRQKPACS
ncbi:uncharacterized protein TNCV_4651871 [Trichonephila clavipes]|nr:uncharacterized protein TNCV_4651871 [Trichonephila clavipes]